VFMWLPQIKNMDTLTTGKLTTLTTMVNFNDRQLVPLFTNRIYHW